jgi:hypothetical protein
MTEFNKRKVVDEQIKLETHEAEIKSQIIDFGRE